jgi:SNF2 family DNA or RNA helicase
MLSAFKELRKQGLIKKMLVICPIRPAHIVWPAEIAKWQQFSDLKISVVHGPDKKAALAANADVYVINPDGLAWLYKQPNRFGPSWMLCVDESSNFKNGRSVRFKILRHLLSSFSRRVIMTGSFAPNGLKNIWSQVYLLDEGRRLGRFVTHFFNTFFYASGYLGYEHTLREGADVQIYSLISDIVVHKSRDLLNMPGLTKNIIKIDMPNTSRAQYDEMRREMVIDIAGEEITAVNAAVKIGKLKQMSNGSLYAPDGSTRMLHSAKVEALVELHEELEGRPLLVFYEYLHDLAQLQKAFPKAPALGGHTSSKDALKHITAWNQGNVPVMFLHPASAGHGLNLQSGGCQDVAFFSITWDLELHDQAIGRVWRQGAAGGVTAHYLVGRRTIDESIIAVLDGKATLQQALMEAVEK